MSVDQGVQREIDRPDGGATDGRLLRSERTKQAIVDALLELIREGTVRPSSAQIAERAGVTQRTLFNQFGDMETLLDALAERQTARVVHLLPRVATGPLEERAHQFCDELAVLLDEVMNIRWAVVTSPEGIKRFGQGTTLLTTVLRHQLDETFEPELASLVDADRQALLDIFEIEIDPLTWRLRRLQQGRSTEAARDLVERAMLALLRGSG